MYLISKTNPDLRIPINEEKYILDEGSKLVRLLAECTNEVKALPKRTDRSFERANSTLWSFVENLQPHYTSEVSSQRISGLSISLSTKVDEYAHQYLRLLHQWCHVRIELNRTLQEYFTSLRMSTEEILNALTQEPKNPIKGGRAQELSRSSYTTDF
ncbi:hypothetical protein X801_00483 [Opisthorchis viverrini]|uniref:Uncharacterized protein n=1 Tax=Opisthorchis viverrini TaxID=6198 RepID=A0A1S8XA77_OPIVI|nr:hypothetical protein X801_00483 [Opisthorchis viverrini]